MADNGLEFVAYFRSKSIGQSGLGHRIVVALCSAASLLNYIQQLGRRNLNRIIRLNLRWIP